MSLKLPTELPATLDLGHGFTLVIMSSREYVTAFLKEGDRILAYQAEDVAPAALLHLVSCEELEDARFPAPVALALRDLAHEAVDLVTARMSAEPIETAVFAQEPIPGVFGGLAPAPLPAATPDYDPETHKWNVGDWFEVVDTDYTSSMLIDTCGKGPHQATMIGRGGDVWVVNRYFLRRCIRPCPPPTRTPRKENADA